MDASTQPAAPVVDQADDPTVTIAKQPAGRRSSPQVDDDGFVEVPQLHCGHQRTTPRTAHTSTATQLQSRYHVLMEEAMETLTAHASKLETTAAEHQQTRMDQTQMEIQPALLAAAIGKIQQAAETQCAAQREN
jgi:hypothetical protein